MRKSVIVAATTSLLIVLLTVIGGFASQTSLLGQSSNIRADSESDSTEIGVFTIPFQEGINLENGAPQENGDSYLANPLPGIPDGEKEEAFGAAVSAADIPSAEQDECYEYISNPSFEANGDWFGQPSSNVGFSEESWVSGQRSVFLDTNFYSSSALWQTVQVPANINGAGLSFYTGASFADPGETVYIAIYDEAFSQLIFWDYLNYAQIGAWFQLADSLPHDLIAGRTIQLTFQMEQDYDNFYSEVLFDDVSLVFCSPDAGGPPTATPRPTATSTATTVPPTAQPTATSTLLPTNTPVATPTPVTPEPGSNIDLAITGIQIGQALMADGDPVTGVTLPLIAGKPALARVYIDVTGTESISNLDATLFMRDAQNQIRSVNSLNGPIQLIGDSTEGSPGSTLNFLLDIAWLNGEIDFWAEVDSANLISESNEGNNVSPEIVRTFQPGPKVRIAWVSMNEGVDQSIAATGDSDLRRFFPTGVNDIEYYFQPGFNQQLDALLSVNNYDTYFNVLNQFWDRMTHEGNWVGGAPPDRLYGWVAGQPTGLCGVADATWAGGRGRAVVGYAESCGAETFAHEIGHVLNDFGLRHSPNLDRFEDPNCINSTGGPEPQYPRYPGLPLGSIGVVGFDADQLNLLYPNQHYDFMSYCAPEWISPFNYARMALGFGAPRSVVAAKTEEVSAKLLVSGLIYTDTFKVDLDPFYVIRSDVAPDADNDGEFCVELRNESDATLDSRCFELTFYEIETGQETEADGFSMVAPYPQETTAVVVTRNGSELARRTISRNHPFVRLTSPTGGADLSGDEVTVTWNGADLDEDTLLHYSLDYSTDAGATWLPLVLGLTGNSTVVDLTTLPGSSQVQFRIGASDGVNTTYDTSDSLEIGFVANNNISVQGKPPTAVIRTQTSRIEAGSAMALEGTGFDLEDGLLPEENLQWWSNRDGVLGTGSWLRPMLSTGAHMLSLTVTDSDGNTDVSTKFVQVGESEGALFLPFAVR